MRELFDEFANFVGALLARKWLRQQQARDREVQDSDPSEREDADSESAAAPEIEHGHAR